MPLLRMRTTWSVRPRSGSCRRLPTEHGRVERGRVGPAAAETSIRTGPVRDVPESGNSHTVALFRVLRGRVPGADDRGWYPTRGNLCTGTAFRVRAAGAPHDERDDQRADRGDDSDQRAVFSDSRHPDPGRGRDTNSREYARTALSAARQRRATPPRAQPPRRSAAAPGHALVVLAARSVEARFRSHGRARGPRGRLRRACACARRTARARSRPPPVGAQRSRPAALTDGFVNAFWSGAAIAFAGVLVSIFLVRGRDLLRPERAVAKPALEEAA